MNYKILNELRSNGVIKKKFFQIKYNDQIFPSLNFRLSDLHASIGITQLKKINKFIKYRKKLSLIYKRDIKNPSVYEKICTKRN